MSNTIHQLKEAVDPVCGMIADTSSASLVIHAEGRMYYFCSSKCRDEFEKHPECYAGKRKNWWGRYLDRVRKATGGKPMSCCH